MKKSINDVVRVSGQKRKRFRLLMTAALDGELSLEEERELRGFLLGSSACRLEWSECKRLATVLRQMRFAQPPKEVWNRFWIDVSKRIE